MRSELIRLWLTVALAIVLAVATVSYHSTPIPTGGVSQSRGELLFLTKGCTGCHSIQGIAERGQIGPDLTFVAGVAGERVEGLSAQEYIAQSLASPQAFYVPGFGPTVAQMPDLNLSNDEIDALVDFLLEER